MEAPEAFKAALCHLADLIETTTPQEILDSADDVELFGSTRIASLWPPTSEQSRPWRARLSRGIAKMDAATPLPDFDAMRRELEEARDAMRRAIEEVRAKPEIVQIFIRANQISVDATVRSRKKKNSTSHYAFREIALRVDRLRGKWLKDLEKAGRRFMGRPGEGVKIGTPPPRTSSFSMTWISAEMPAEGKARTCNCSPTCLQQHLRLLSPIRRHRGRDRALKNVSSRYLISASMNTPNRAQPCRKIAFRNMPQI
jgi:hypothetical protein